MKYLYAILFLYLPTLVLLAQPNSPLGKIVITFDNKKTMASSDENGKLFVNVNPEDVVKLSTLGVVRYSDFGAKGDGTTDDMDAIAATHAFANQKGILVKADEGLTYYIGGKKRTAIIRTDTDFGTASFIINDTNVQNRNAPIFQVNSDWQPIKLKTIPTLKKNQQKIEVSLPENALITVTNSHVKRFIRLGNNQDNGSRQTDVFLVDKNGNVDGNTPIIWDFDQVTEMLALPIDGKILTIKGGYFTTIANKAESKYTYYNRNIAIRRSNVVVEGLEHRILGEGNQSAPYGGFLNIGFAYHVIVKNTTLSGHKTYSTMVSAGTPVSMGTYDISINNSIDVSFVNCNQTNDIENQNYWGIMVSNFCKNLTYDHCTFSRFDAHKGVYNATIRNSTLGHMGITIIGSGVLTVENTSILARNFISLRSDYGSSWQGEFFIRNCIFVPDCWRSSLATLISGTNTGQHDFGYTCHMPERITIENLQIKDSKYARNYTGPSIFGNFNPQWRDDTYQELFPYVKTKEVILKNVSIESGKTLRISDNKFMFENTKVDNQ